MSEPTWTPVAPAPEPPAAPPEPDAAPPAADTSKDELRQLLEDAKGHLAGGGGVSAAAAVLIRAVELLAGL